MPEPEDFSKLGVTQMAPLQATIIGSGTGDGGMSKTHVIETPAGQPNIVLRVISPLVALSVRFAETFLTALLGGTGLDTITSWAQVTDLQVSSKTLVYVALSTAVLGLAKDLIVILGRLKARFPLLDA